ncbi:ATP-binding protein [Sphingobium sufflavum]|uniref:sensor histidine kinase n=1 Tax=Sphingobium sufflavum TaxID=1129547 RepID=UPI001F38C801|nr:ATP-binding protein [Sphingobium sufflavum]MCE7796488.1 ATP-binding protein [Sphingobium sufflavum]
MFRLVILSWTLAALLLGALAALLAGQVIEQRVSASFAASTAADARLRQALLASEIARFRLLPLALTDDRDVVAAVEGAPGAAHRLDAKLEGLAARVGAAAIYVVGPDGLAIAASNWRTSASFVGQPYGFRRYYADAVRSGAGEQFALGTISHKPGLYLARKGRGGSVVVVKLEFDGVERQWRAAGGITFVSNAAGVVVVASRPDWRFATIGPIPPAAAAAARVDMGVAALRSTPFRRLDGGRMELPGSRAGLLLATTAPDASGWRVNLALPAGTAVDSIVRTAQIAIALATLLIVGLAGLLRERSRRRRERTSALEAAVAERTANLSREMEERAAAEARAADLREGLRQANRLATLGQVTASVAHETAQPVAAIRTYAASAEQLLDRGEVEEVRGNLRAIARLTERIGAVTAELRSFARKGSGTIGAIPLVEVIEGALLILKEPLSRIRLEIPPLSLDLCVMAGRVRLEQVVVNLLQNALDALADGPDARIILSLERGEAEVRLSIADNGPGISPDVADRLFTPFTTSRETGLGLGLVIAQDIMTDMGGTLRLLPSEKGACFAMTLKRAL